MSVLNPQTIYNELIETINRYMTSCVRPSDFEHRRILRDVEKLKTVNPSQGWLASAMVASLLWDGNTVLRSATNAVALAPGDVDSLLVASQCLWNTGLYAQAEAYSHQALSTAPNNSRVLQAVAEQLVCKAKLAEVGMLVKRAESMGITLDIGDYQPHQERFQELGLTDERVQFEASLAIEVMAKKCVRAQGISITPWVDPDTGLLQVSMAYSFIGSIQQEIELENDLADCLSQDPAWSPGKLSTEFEALSATDGNQSR